MFYREMMPRSSKTQPNFPKAELKTAATDEVETAATDFNRSSAKLLCSTFAKNPQEKLLAKSREITF